MAFFILHIWSGASLNFFSVREFPMLAWEFSREEAQSVEGCFFMPFLEYLERKK